MSRRIPFHEQVTTTPEIVERFGDIHPPLDRQAAIPEANRCLFCFDAPCTTACPTHIDVPRFIKKIVSGNVAGSARTILDANILGASCARACPVEVLCEGACVMHRFNKQPIQIARLHPPGLKAVIAVCATEELFHDDIHYIDNLLHVDEFEIAMDLQLGMTRAPDFPLDEASLAVRFDAKPWFPLYLHHQRDG